MSAVGIEEVAKKYGLEAVELDGEKRLVARTSPFYIVIKEGNPTVVRIGVDKEKLSDLIEEMLEEGETPEGVEDILDEMIDETIRIAYTVIGELEKEKKEVKSELLSSVMDIKDIVSEQLEYVEELL